MIDALNEILHANPDDRFLIKVRTSPDVESFAEMVALSTALQTIDSFTRRESFKTKKLRRDSLELRAKIVTFYVGSPAETTLFANPAWISVLIGSVALSITFVANYKSIKENLPRVRDDAARLIGNIRGLAANHLRYYRLAAEYVIDRLLETPEDQLRGLANRLRTVRRSLTINQHLPEIEFVDRGNIDEEDVD